jgi:hypothetical protein
MSMSMTLCFAAVFRRNTLKTLMFSRLFRFSCFARNTPSLSACNQTVFPCFACFSPKGERAARNTRVAALPGEARQ